MAATESSTEMFAADVLPMSSTLSPTSPEFALAAPSLIALDTSSSCRTYCSALFRTRLAICAAVSSPQRPSPTMTAPLGNLRVRSNDEDCRSTTATDPSGPG